MKDYYKILEVSENSTQEDIKKSYRNLSKKYHPDVNPQGAEKFKEVAEAYETLGDPQKKASYDNMKNNPFGAFSQMFDFGFARQQRKSAPDKIVKIQINPVESFISAEKTIQYMRENHCEPCAGSGGDRETCKNCNGSGFQVKTFGNGFILQQVRTTCNSCGGKGFSITNKCYMCNGQGSKPSVTSVNIKIPHGADSGNFVKLQNMGDFSNGEYGDLIVQVEMINKDGFEKINDDLVYNLYLTKEDLESDKYSIPHPDGELSVSAPKTFDTSKPLRIRGRGYKNGDMYVKLNVKFQRSE